MNHSGNPGANESYRAANWKRLDQVIYSQATHQCSPIGTQPLIHVGTEEWGYSSIPHPCKMPWWNMGSSERTNVRDTVANAMGPLAR
jgi:hypothetical protein